MNANKLKKYAILKYFSIASGVVIGFIQPKIFSDIFTESDFAALTVLFGFAAFLSFFDFGFSKPIYAELRSRYVVGRDWSKFAWTSLVFFGVTAFIASIISFMAAAIFIKQGNYSFNLWFCILFSIILSANLFINCVENIFNALDAQVQYATLDVLRRAVNIGSIFLSYYDDSLVLPLGVNVIFLLAISIFYVLGVIKILKFHNYLVVLDHGFFRKTWSKSKNYFIFAVCETIIYNWGYLVFPLNMSSHDLVVYGLWMRIFLGVTLVMGVVANVFIHPISRFYIEGKKSEARNAFLKALKISVILSFFGCGTFALLMPYLLPYWVGSEYIFSAGLLMALFTWCIGNSIQHCSGVFLLSLGTQFGVMKNTSILILMSLVLMIVPMVFMTKELALILIGSSFIYCFGACFYLYRAISLVGR